MKKKHDRTDEYRWLTVVKAATYAGVSPTTLRREAKAGRLRGVKIGRRFWRFERVDIDSWLESRKAT